MYQSTINNSMMIIIIISFVLRKAKDALGHEIFPVYLIAMLIAS